MHFQASGRLPHTLYLPGRRWLVPLGTIQRFWPTGNGIDAMP
jgi:hypothetical protein